MPTPRERTDGASNKLNHLPLIHLNTVLVILIPDLLAGAKLALANVSEQLFFHNLACGGRQ
jgi:hypothetical protein